MQNKNSPITLAGAIIIAGAIIAMAILWNKEPRTNNSNNTNIEQETISLAPITTDDHILGNPNAPIKIVEFSDPSCPYCKTFHTEMLKLMAEYGPTGKVAWIYRAFPLDTPDQNGRVLHPNAAKESEALECAAAFGGNDKFWAYTNRLYEITPSVTSASPNGLDPKKLPEIAVEIGLDLVSFNDCLASGRFKDKINAQFLDGVDAGVEGTPTSFVLINNKDPIPLRGVLPYANLKKAVETILANLATNTNQ